MHGFQTTEGLLSGDFRPQSTVLEVFWVVERGFSGMHGS